MSEQASAGLLAFCKGLLPEASRIHTGRWKHLSKQASKLFCYDLDDAGWAPQYKFADMAPKDYTLRHSGIRGTPLEALVDRIAEYFGVAVNHVTINCYPTRADYIPPHKVQPTNIASASNSYETEDWSSSIAWARNDPFASSRMTE